MKAPSTELVPVPFYGDMMLATQLQGRTYTSLKRVCENIGIDYASQLDKLRSAKWATVDIISTVAEDGKPRRVVMIDVRSLSMWLVTIRPSKVAFDVRDRLERYQMEAAEVLANFCLGEKKSEDLPAIRRRLDRLNTNLNLLTQERKRIETRVKEVGAELRDLQYQIGLLMDPFKVDASIGVRHYMTRAEHRTKRPIRGRDGEPIDRDRNNLN